MIRVVMFVVVSACLLFFFFFNDTATTEIYTLSLHDALPISVARDAAGNSTTSAAVTVTVSNPNGSGDRKSTRLKSSHDQISYAVFCLKKKKIPHKKEFGHPQQPAVMRSLSYLIYPVL